MFESGKGQNIVIENQGDKLQMCSLSFLHSFFSLYPLFYAAFCNSVLCFLLLKHDVLILIVVLVE